MIHLWVENMREMRSGYRILKEFLIIPFQVSSLFHLRIQIKRSSLFSIAGGEEFSFCMARKVKNPGPEGPALGYP